jgi:hypothetical protein
MLKTGKKRQTRAIRGCRKKEMKMDGRDISGHLVQAALAPVNLL